jgi:hypothetical protein
MRSGWRHESYRHSLAARGVRTVAPAVPKSQQYFFIKEWAAKAFQKSPEEVSMRETRKQQLRAYVMEELYRAEREGRIPSKAVEEFSPAMENSLKLYDAGNPYDQTRDELERKLQLHMQLHATVGQSIMPWGTQTPSQQLQQASQQLQRSQQSQQFFARKSVSSVSSEELQRWKQNVNMSSSELKRFMNVYGSTAGLSRTEAAGEGIKSGRDSARAIIRMKQKPVREWNDTDVAWMRRQNRFVARMRGAKGPLYTDKGAPTRKLLALKVWGHDPEKRVRA